MKLSEIFCTPVEVADEKTTGYILAVCHTDDLIDGYICCDEQENELFVDAKKIRFSKDGAKVLKVGVERKKAERIRLGYALYGEDGKFLGRIDDFTVRSGKITNAHVGNKKYPYSRIVFGDVAILKSERAEADSAAKNMFIGAMLNAAPEVKTV